MRELEEFAQKSGYRTSFFDLEQQQILAELLSAYILNGVKIRYPATKTAYVLNEDKTGTLHQGSSAVQFVPLNALESSLASILA